MNYRDVCARHKFPIPEQPIVFNKLPRCIRGPDDDILLSAVEPNLDFEVELAIVIGKRCRYVSEADAESVIAGYTVGHDLSGRTWQKRNGGQVFISKTLESYAPIGPYLVPASEEFDPNN
jgi:2,4-diketo-3-deoxy-L-fuconate hydrolase